MAAKEAIAGPAQNRTCEIGAALSTSSSSVSLQVCSPVSEQPSALAWAALAWTQPLAQLHVEAEVSVTLHAAAAPLEPPWAQPLVPLHAQAAPLVWPRALAVLPVSPWAQPLVLFRVPAVPWVRPHALVAPSVRLHARVELLVPLWPLAQLRVQAALSVQPWARSLS